MYTEATEFPKAFVNGQNEVCRTKKGIIWDFI